MKKLCLLLVVSLLLGLAFATDAEQECFSSFNSTFEILSSDQSKMEINFQLPTFEVEEVLSSNQTFHKIALPGAPSLMKSGYPELPFITTSVAIPHQGKVNIEILDSAQSVLTSYNAYPVQQGDNMEAPKAFVINQDYYSGNINYPEEIVQYTDPMILRELRIITVQINPFSYNADTQELTVRNNIRMRLNFSSEPGVNELPGPVEYISPSFDKIYDSFILNYDQYRYAMHANTPPRYLVIYGHSTDASFQALLNGFVLWKKQKGADVDVFSTQQAGTSTTAIQTFIRGRYTNLATRPDFVILIGDTTGSYPIPCWTVTSGSSDYPYSFMNTEDSLGDVFIGRISVENLAQFSNLVSKGFTYEKNINLSNADWLNRMLLIGDWQPSGISTMYINKYIKEIALSVNPEYTFTEAYSDGTSTHIANPAMTNGVAFYSFRGYIDFVPPSESDINNGPKLIHAVVITCGTGNFNGLAKSEQFIRLGTDASPKGAVTCIGMATSSTQTTFNNTIHGGIFEGVFGQGMRTMGEALLHGKLFLHQVFGVSSPSSVDKFSGWCNLMGDPTVEVFVGIPDALTVTTNTTIPVGLSLMDVLVTNQDDEPVAGAAVTISMGTGILARGYTDEAGLLILQLPENLIAGNAAMTVSKHDCKPTQINITIDGSGTLIPATVLVDDDNDEGTVGNGNGIATAGETIALTLGLVNTGDNTVTGISGTIVSDSPFIEILNPEVSYPDAHSMVVVDNIEPILIQIDPATPPNSMVRLHILLTDDDDNEYDISEFMPVEAVELIFNDLHVISDPNGALDPDEERVITVALNNISEVSVEGVHARLYTENHLLSVIEGSYEVGEIPAAIGNDPAIIMADFTVWQRPQTLPGMVMPLRVRLYNDDGFEQTVYFTLTVGEATEHDPLGPCEYGYVIYDVTDVGYPECPSYNWTEIATPLGGQGTALTLTDPYNSSNEGDQVGSQALAVVNLPFQFKFYGELYSQITVCSNGFIGLGVTENAEFRNFRLPGPMGPNPMIAPFWDDLAIHNGSGVYTFYDRGRKLFIIEWYNMKNGKNGTSVETFQVILYDQVYHATSLGDGPIKFQYQTFNNVDSQSGGRHGNYCTIGIKDHTGTRGLEYTFNNTYPTAAAPLENGTALYISTIPTYYEEANLEIVETYIAVEDDIVTPGKEVELGILLKNSGNMGVENVSATLVSNDPFVTIYNDVSEYHPLGVGDNSVNSTPFLFKVSEACPSNYLINFNLIISTGLDEWERQFSIQVVAPSLGFHSQMIDDYAGDYNGVVGIDESIKYVVNIRNQSDAIARNVSAFLSTDVPNISILNPEITDITIMPNRIMQLVFDLEFSGESGSGTFLPLNLSLSYNSGDVLEIPLAIPYNIEGVYEDFELNNGGFIGETGWEWGVPEGITPFSGTKLWATGLNSNYDDLVQYYLYSPEYYLKENSQLSFMHYYELDNGQDGVNVSISVDNGLTWELMTPLDGYDNTSIPGLDNQPGWTGESSVWTNALFDLSNYANQKIMIRFRLGSDDNYNSRGWYIDDFTISNVHQKTGFIQGTVILSSIVSPTEVELFATNNFASNPDEFGAYRIYLPYGTHSLTANLDFHRSSTSHNLAITVEQPILNRDFTLIDMPPVSNLSSTLSEDKTVFDMSWNAPEAAILNPQNYRVYRKFDSGPYDVVQESLNMVYHEVYSIEGKYLYYVAAIYDGIEGEPTMIDPDPPSNEDDLSPQLVTALDTNYPNPFNPSTTINFSLAKPGKASIRIYNTKGQLVKNLISGEFNAGYHNVVWNGRDDKDKPVASGMYFYRMETNDFKKTRKMVLMK